jgi:D-glycero-alpha-D-manno-heptose-7-phosphate kinase
MIISRTPLRMSFVGGGSDLPGFYREFGGAVLSTSINKYIYVNVNQKFDQGIRIAYSKTEEVVNVTEIEHKLVRECLKFLELSGGLEITTIADIPSKGTGLGSSSSFTIALLHALNAYQGKYISNEQLAKDCCKIEIDFCREPIGKQDQFAAALGGFNLLEFKSNEKVIVTPVIASADIIKNIESNLLLLYTGITRSASELLLKQSQGLKNNKQKKINLQRMVDLVYILYKEIQNSNITAFGEIMHENWQLKKSLEDNISNTQIDLWYDIARKNGAIGGKILGAGAGGFLLLYAPKDKHNAICESLKELKQIDFSFENEGSKIIYYNPNKSK